MLSTHNKLLKGFSSDGSMFVIHPTPEDVLTKFLEKKEEIANFMDKMFAVQNRLNIAAIGENWRDLKLKFSDAIMTEATELFDHTNWPWWKNVNSPIDWGQVKMELIDIFHFYMSQTLQFYRDDEANRITRYDLNPRITRTGDGTKSEHYSIVEVGTGTGDIDVERVRQAARNLIEASARSANVLSSCHVEIRELVEALNMPISNIFKLYMGKALLNLFRWSHGYKQGTYLKNWKVEQSDGSYKTIEDNQWVTEYMATANINSETFEKDFNDSIEKAYQQALEKETNE